MTQRRTQQPSQRRTWLAFPWLVPPPTGRACPRPRRRSRRSRSRSRSSVRSRLRSRRSRSRSQRARSCRRPRALHRARPRRDTQNTWSTTRSGTRCSPPRRRPRRRRRRRTSLNASEGVKPSTACTHRTLAHRTEYSRHARRGTGGQGTRSVCTQATALVSGAQKDKSLLCTAFTVTRAEARPRRRRPACGGPRLISAPGPRLPPPGGPAPAARARGAVGRTRACREFSPACAVLPLSTLCSDTPLSDHTRVFLSRLYVSRPRPRPRAAAAAAAAARNLRAAFFAAEKGQKENVPGRGARRGPGPAWPHVHATAGSTGRHHAGRPPDLASRSTPRPHPAAVLGRCGRRGRAVLVYNHRKKSSKDHPHYGF